jgi:hypothetical protein
MGTACSTVYIAAWSTPELDCPNTAIPYGVIASRVSGIHRATLRDPVAAVVRTEWVRSAVVDCTQARLTAAIASAARPIVGPRWPLQAVLEAKPATTTRPRPAASVSAYAR